jgi:hypothetical protein
MGNVQLETVMQQLELWGKSPQTIANEVHIYLYSRIEKLFHDKSNVLFILQKRNYCTIERRKNEKNPHPDFHELFEIVFVSYKNQETEAKIFF